MNATCGDRSHHVGAAPRFPIRIESGLARTAVTVIVWAQMRTVPSMRLLEDLVAVGGSPDASCLFRAFYERLL